MALEKHITPRTFHPTSYTYNWFPIKTEKPHRLIILPEERNIQPNQQKTLIKPLSSPKIIDFPYTTTSLGKKNNLYSTVTIPSIQAATHKIPSHKQETSLTKYITIIMQYPTKPTEHLAESRACPSSPRIMPVSSSKQARKRGKPFLLPSGLPLPLPPQNL
jgi:hypothetical protein